MISYFNGDILTSNADVICHQVNCKGVMGCGLALQIKNKYPRVFKQYADRCRVADSSFLLGSNQYFFIQEENRWIANLFCQNGYSRVGRSTDYAAFEKSLTALKSDMSGSTFAFPYKIGCGLGGGDWEIVLSIIEKVFSDYPLEVQIWKFN